MKKIYLTVFLVSSAILSMQIIIIYLLSIIQWYHFAYMIISAALLGFGASGTFVSLFKKKLINNNNVIFYLLILFSITSVISIYSTTGSILTFDSYLLFTDYFQMSKLFINYIIFFIPFFCGAVILALSFIMYSEIINKIYYINLIGSAFGAIIPLIIIKTIRVENFILFISLLPFIASILLINYLNIKKEKCKLLFILLNLIIIIYFFLIPKELNISEYKGLSYALNLHNTVIKGERKSIYGLMKYVETPLLRYAPGVSLNYRGKIPTVDMIYLNSEPLGPVFKNINELEIFNYTPKILPYKLSNITDVLVIDAGTFTDAYYAYYNNVQHITAVDLFASETIRLKQKYSNLNPTDKINIISIDAKTYLLTSKKKFDLITIPAIDSFGGGAGLYALQENYTVTVESLSKIMKMLKPGGVLYLPVWTDHPPRNFLKILSALAETLEGLSLPLENHIAAVRDWGMLHFIVKTTEFSEKDYEIINKFCSNKNFDIAILKGLKIKDRMKFNIIDKTFFHYIDEIITGNREIFYDNYKFNIKPPTDNKPYFYNFIKWRTMPEIIKTEGIRDFAFKELGYLILIYTFIQIIICALILIILPLIKLNKRLSNKLYSVIYFSSLGLGYMFFEITLIQKFTLYFGSPVYSASFIISFMLALSGAGSYYSGTIKPTKKNISKICFLVSAVMLSYFLFIHIIFNSTINYPLFYKILISFFIISPLAFVMGMPFPLGLKYISVRNKDGIPWCWGINGCLSVIASVLAIIICVEFGFIAAGVTGLFFYFAAGLINIL